MKHFFIRKTLLTALISSSFFLLLGCNNNSSNIKEIRVDGKSNSYFYKLGDDFLKKYQIGDILYNNVPDILVFNNDGTNYTISYGNNNLTYSGYDGNKEGKQTITVTYKDNNIEFKDSYEITVLGNSGPAFLSVPDETNEILYPGSVKGTDYYVKMVNENAIRSYQWQTLRVYSKYHYEWRNLTGIYANTNRLHISGIIHINSPSFYRCVVTDIFGRQNISKEFKVKAKVEENTKQAIFVCDYPITIGTTLDLKDTMVGEGKISLNEENRNLIITFENTNINDEKHFVDYSYYYGTGLTYYKINNSYDNVIVKIIGKNTIKSSLFSVNDSAGTYGMAFISGGETINVSIENGKDAELNFYGTYGGIVGKANVSLNVDTNFISLPSVPTTCFSLITLTVEENTNIYVNGNYLFFSTFIQKSGTISIVNFKSGSRLTANFVVIPCNLELKQAVINIIECSEVYINNASINICLKINEEAFISQNIVIVSLSIFTLWGVEKTSLLSIENNSNISLNIEGGRSFKEDFINNTTAISFINTNILDSTLNIFIQAYDIFYNNRITGIASSTLNIENSNVNIDLRSDCRVVQGIEGFNRFFDDSLKIINSYVKINITSIYSLEENGIFGILVEGKINISNNAIVEIDTNKGLAIASLLSKDEEPKQYTPGYVIANITCGKLNVEESSSGEINIISIKAYNSINYYTFETSYYTNGDDHIAGKNIIIYGEE